MADAAPGQELWAVYVDAWAIPTPEQGDPPAPTTTTPDGHDALSSGEDRWWAAESRVGHAGYVPTLTPLSCDQGAANLAFAPPVPAGAGIEGWAVAVYFKTEADARSFADILPGTESAIGPIRRTCTVQNGG